MGRRGWAAKGSCSPSVSLPLSRTTRRRDLHLASDGNYVVARLWTIPAVADGVCVAGSEGNEAQAGGSHSGVSTPVSSSWTVPKRVPRFSSAGSLVLFQSEARDKVFARNPKSEKLALEVPMLQPAHVVCAVGSETDLALKYNARTRRRRVCLNGGIRLPFVSDTAIRLSPSGSDLGVARLADQRL